MRKLLLSMVCMLFMTGLVLATEYTIVSYDKEKKTLTVKPLEKDAKDVKAVATDKTKITLIDKDGNKKEGKLEDVEKRWGSDKAVGKKVNLTIEDGKITEVTVMSKK